MKTDEINDGSVMIKIIDNILEDTEEETCEKLRNLKLHQQKNLCQKLKA